MAVNYVVQADVIDIQSDRPQRSDRFLVDSNVWFWMTYSGAGLGADWRARVYPNYFKLTLAARSKLYRCGFSMAELAHLIERAECDIFLHTHPGETPKHFRHNYPDERKDVASAVQAAWGAVKAIASPLDLTMDDPTTDSALARFQTQLLDGYDLFMVEAMVAGSVDQILTDDGDYCTVPSIQVFTANRKVIDAARDQGKLLLR